MLGCAVAAMEGEEPFSLVEMQMARTAIVAWHRLQAIAAE